MERLRGAFAILFKNTSNLEEARGRGIKPVSFNQIREQLCEDLIPTMVFFDTPPSFSTGNHWRVLEIDPQEKSVSLQLCGPFGNYDYRETELIILPVDKPFFTGVSIQGFIFRGLRASLSKVVQAVESSTGYPEDLKYEGEVIYWSNEHCQLTDQPPNL